MLLDQISMQTPEQALQLNAAKLALEGRFKEAVFMMLESMGLDTTHIPQWALPGPITEDRRGQAQEIGNAFLYHRLRDMTHGWIAVCILRGDYGIATQLMIEIEMAPMLARQLNLLPEEIGEILQYLEDHPPMYAANDTFLPSWAR